MFDFEFSRLRLEFKALNSFQTPYFLGSAFRGIMGKNLKKIVCIKPFEESCKNCQLKDTCPYTVIFETEEILNYPAKYAIKPPFQVIHLQENQTINLDITLLGSSANYWEFIISSFSNTLNLGKERYLKLDKIYFYNPIEEKYYPLKRNIPKFQAKDLLNLKTDKQQLTLQLNPTSIKHQNQIVNPQDFNRDILIKAILTRISAVAQSYGEKTEKIYIDKEKINITQQNLEQTILKRYSNRKQRHMNIPAIEGELTLTGDLNQIYGLLKIIENINLGKSVSLGLGSVKLLSENSTWKVYNL